ncbi:mitochondrial ribonuclease P catalytic subunit [Diorhabda sublineata]|uniref:mitochondrial ribonuclease P catalytic subunit n=1 Tax=Diorhabda sublineata TaxID=1163346 RepID=UPI0024E0826B|nr:mitochondrial ribonuclease P catalytic subunit [Diorhabda sublineata]
MILKQLNRLYVRNYSFKKNILPQKKQVTQNYLVEAIENKIITQRDWKLVRQDIIDNVDNRGQYTKNNVDSLILGYCIKENKFDLGSHYINFVKEENISPTLAFIGKHLKFLYEVNKEKRFINGEGCEKAEEKLILQIYSDLRKDFPVLDSFSLENIIPAISLTSEWKKCIELLKEIEFTNIPNSHAYSCTVAAAFLNNEEQLAWELLEEIVQHGRNVENIVFFSYFSWLRTFKNRKNTIAKLEQMFLFLQSKDLLCELEVVENIINFSSKGNITHIQKGVCQNCSNHLTKFDINNEEFEELKTKIFEKVILGRDVFVKTNPQELKLFEAFMSNSKRFDVVLDGLNIAYSAGTRQPPRVLATLLASVVSHFAEKNKEVLVVGRRHMTKWPRDIWSCITEQATVFLAQNISQDDPYLLYCALNSGKDTIIVTRDLMRSHKFLLNDLRLRILFNRWLSLRQYQLVKVVGEGKPIFRHPLRYSVTAQKNGSYWHIPIKPNVSKESDNNIQWLCLNLTT